MASLNKNNTRKNDIEAIKEQALDIVKSVLTWAVITGLAFLYWMAVFLIISLILLNVWHVKFDSILKYAIVLTIITSIAYIAKKIYKTRK